MTQNVCSKALLPLLTACLLAGSSTVSRANSYASSLTNNAGTVSFRLNDAADNVKVVSGALTIDLGALPRGLTVTNLTSQGLAAGAFSVVVVKSGTGTPTKIGDPVTFNSPRGVTVNNNPRSAYFGRVYVANSAAGTKGDGLFYFSADLTDISGQGATAKTGGMNVATGGTSSPYRPKVGVDDDQLYLTDWSDGSGNLYVTDPDITAGGYVLKQLTGTAAVPVGVDNTHGSVAAVEALGKLENGNLSVFTIDEDYQSDPTSTSLTEENSLWNYNVGSGPLPWQNPPDVKVVGAPINFVSQTMDLSYSPGAGYFYVMDRRSAGNETGVTAVDFGGNVVFTSKQASVDLGNATDFLNDLQGITASPDGKYFATIANNNLIQIMPMVGGIPQLAARVTFNPGTTASGRGIAFDRANNLYYVSSGLGVLQSLSAGFSATNTTSSDGTFKQETPSAFVSADFVDPNNTTLSEANTAQTVSFKVYRPSDNTATQLAVNLTFGGTATRGTGPGVGDYYIKTNGVAIATSSIVAIPAGADNVVVEVVANDDNISELAETIVMSIGSGSYVSIAPLGGTVTITDNDATAIDISSVVYSQMFEGNPFDFARFTVERRGDLSLGAFDANIAYAGTATKGVDYTPINSVHFEPGEVSHTFDVQVIDDTTVEGNETVIASIATGTGYAVGTNNVLTAGATATIVDDDTAPESPIFSEDFNDPAHEANWKLVFGSVNPDSGDYVARFGVDYTAELNVPPAPHSNGDSLGLLLSVNKLDTTAEAAGLNLYPIGKTFSGDYALRFDMYLMQNGSAATTEYATFGINHDTTHTNWFRNSGSGVQAGTTFDGIWAYVEADGAALGDYVLNSAPAAALNGPTALTSRSAESLASVFHNPPWSAGGAGAPANSPATDTPSWAQVEVKQVGGVVTVSINNTQIMVYTNKTAFTSGDIMLGYDDAYDSIGSGGGGLVIYDNVRVVSIAAPASVKIISVTQVGSNLQIDFNGVGSDPLSAFKVYGSTTVGGTYTEVAGATYSVVTAGDTYRAVVPISGTTGFFKIAKP